MAKRKVDIEALIEEFMEKNPKYSYVEAKEMVKYDLETDAMSVSEISKEMTPEEKEAMKEATKVSRGPAAPGKKKERKPKAPNELKIEMMKIVIDALEAAGYEGIEVTNVEREVQFVGPDGKPYKFTMAYRRNDDKAGQK